MIEPRRFWCDSRAALRRAADEILRLDAAPGRVAEIIVRPARKEKTHDQRKLWHAMLDELGAELGHTPRETKEMVKAEYYGTETVTLPNGARYEVLRSSEEEDRKGYGRLIDFTVQFAAEQGIVLRERGTANQGATR